MRALLIVNPVASRVNAAVERTARRELETAADVEVVRTTRPLGAAELARRGVDEGFGAVIVLGGDGTANEVLNGVGSAIPIGLLPGGGTSVMPRNLGLPPSIPAAARRLAAALAEGRERSVRVGRINGRRFAFNAGVGLDAEVVRRVDGRERTDKHRRSADVVYARELAKLVARGAYSQPRITVHADRQVERVAFVVAVNLAPWSYIGPLPLDLAPTATADGGLDIVAPRRLYRRDVAGFAQRILLDQRHARGSGDPRIAYWHDIARIDLRCDEPFPTQVDGDYVGDVTDALIDVDPAGARYLL
ncbi:MAG: diacylglycerol/lipid kinase family protein [Gaiellales bacterium]